MKVKYDLHDVKKQKQSLPEYKQLNNYRANRKILGLTRFHLRLYNLATSVKDTTVNDHKVRRFFRKVGEHPVLFDSLLAEKSANNIKQFLFNSGYYDADVYYTVKYKKNKVKYLMYHIDPNSYYNIKNYFNNIGDSVLNELVAKHIQNTFIKFNRRLEFENIDRERERILSLIRSNGYFDFKKDYIDFELDTFKLTNKVDVSLNISLPNDQNVLSIYHIDNIIVQLNSPYHKQGSYFREFDSVKYFTNHYPISAKILRNNQMIQKGGVYNQFEIDQTYRKMNDLGVFDNVDIETKKSPFDSSQLFTKITLIPGFQQSFTIEPQIISSDLSNQIANIGNYRNYGVAGIATYSHKNIFKGAERLDLSYTMRAETQIRAKERFNRLFTNFQTGVSANLFIPSSYMWESTAERYKLNTVKTVVSMSYIFEYNLDFKRQIMPMSFSYQFSKGHTMWQLTPLEVSYSNSIIESGFLDKIDIQIRDYVKRLFDNNLITSSGFRWNHNHFKTSNPKDYFMVRMNVIEFGGNLHRLIRRGLDQTKHQDTSYSFLKVNYFQFAKSEIDLRVGKYIDYNNAVAARLNIGVGVPYGNDDILPFDKRFFIGGANSLRGWSPRTLGPGRSIDSSSNTRIDKSGDLIIQGSMEYRFKFISPLELGLFLDAGNIWNIAKNSGTTEAEMFKIKNLFNDMALNTGIGFRFDFDFFIFRLDWGIQLKNPGVSQNNGWVIRELFKTKKMFDLKALQLGVGYPF